jgi:epidermal growth factor receptor substrate 15
MRFPFSLLVFLFLCSFTGYSQDVVFTVYSANYTTSKKEGGATVTVYDGATKVNSMVTNGKGEAIFELSKGKNYKIEVSKAGKVSRFIYVDTKNINDELVQGSGPLTQGANISLFDETPNVDFSYVKQNAITTYSFQNGKFDYDANAASKMKTQIDKILKDAESSAKNAEANYNAAIKAADAFYAQKKYNEAIAEYEKASLAKPAEKYPAQQITAIEAILKAEKAGNEAKAQAEQDYKNLITAADALRDQKKYAEAKAKYLEAYQKKPEPYAKAEADKCDASLANAAKEAENKKNYDAAMTAGNSFFTQKSWMAAKDKYKEALKYIPNDAAANAKLAEIETKLNAQKAETEKKANHDKLVTEADALFAAADYSGAKVKYTEALALMSGSQYETAKIAECNTKIAEAEAAKAKQQQIEKLLADGNTAFTGAKYPDAKLKYQEVLKLDAENATAKGRITEIDAKIAEEKANAQKIADAAKLVTEGDALAKSTKYADAIAKYNAAQALYNNPAVQPKIDAANEALKGAEAAAEKKANFDKAIQEGNDLFAAKKYEEAKAKYNAAAAIDAASAVPKAKIAEVDKAIAADKAAADAATMKANFDKAIQEGDALLASKSYEAAKAKYNEAAGIDSKSTVPKAKIAEVDKAIAADKAATDAATKKANFDKAMQEADALLASKSYDAAKAKYTEAGTIDASSPLPKAKIAEIDKAIAADKAAADAARKKADYDNLLAEGNTLFDAKNYEGAKAKYNAAVAIDNTRNEAKDKLAQITKLASDQAALEKQKKQYETLIAEGNTLQSSGKLAEAKVKFVEANKVDATQTLPVQKIAEIDGLLKAEAQKQEITKLLSEGNTALAAKKYADAKGKYQAVLAIDPNNSEAKTKFDAAVQAEIAQSGAEAKQAQFTALKAEGEALFAKGDYLNAKSKFMEAKSVQADAAVEKRIVECDAKIAELNKANESAQKFAQAVAEAKVLEGASKYDEAIAKYQEALSYQASQEVKDKIDAINKLKAAQASQNQLEADVALLVKTGDEFVAAKEYEKAISAYSQALVKKNDPAIVAKKEAATKLRDAADGAADQAQYDKILSAAQKNFEDKNYPKAIEYYDRAISFRSADPFPKQKKAEIEELMKKEAAYTAKVKEADAAATAGKLENAISLFEEARKIKQDEVYPTNRIQELKAQIAAKTNVVVPNEADVKYKAAMDAGNALASAKDYKGAISKYKEALVAKPNDNPASNKISEMQQILDDMAKAEKKEGELKKLIETADALFKKEDWLAAKNAYDAVLLFDGTNSYSKSQINICEQKLDSIKGATEAREYDKVIKAGDKNFDKKDYTKSKEYYQRALTFRPNDPYPKKRLKEIDALLNPQPVITQTVVNKEPEKLPNLGNPSTSTDEEDGAKLAKTRTFRHARNRNGVQEVHDTVYAAGREGFEIQKERTTENNLEFDQLRAENAQRSDSANLTRIENRNIIDTTSSNIALANQELSNYKSSDITYTNDQLNIIEKENKESSRIYGTVATENAVVFDDQEKELSEAGKKMNSDAYKGNILVDVQLGDVKYEQSKNSKDDLGERQEANKVVNEIVKDNENYNKQLGVDKIAEINDVNDSLNDIRATIDEINIEDKRLAPVNHDKIKEINKEVGEQRKIETDEHNQVTLNHKQIIDEDAKNVQASYANAEQQREVNNAEMKLIKDEQVEIDRVNYNNVYVKAVDNKTTINEGIAVQNEYAALPSITAAANNAVYEDIKAENKERDIERTAAETNKYENNQQSLNETKAVATEQATIGTEKPSENTEILKQKKAGIGEGDAMQKDAQKQNTIEAKKELDQAVANSKPVEVQKGENDLGKLYPEGVSQEKFDQTDRNNMVVAVITRRIVVKGGHGDEYIKTQTLTTTTYTKNGGAITESDWQRETQNANLKRNY